MLEPASSLPAAQRQPALQQATACNGSNAEQQCGDQGCGGGSDPLPAAAAVPAPGTVCIKCRKAEAEVIARGREPLCHPCLHEQLLSKVRNAVRVHSLILPGDRLALAYSGGPASAALLHFLTQLRNPRTDRPARGKVSFTLHVIHIDESAAHGLSPEQQAATTASVAAAAAQYCEGSEGGVAYHCLPLESVFDEVAAAAPADGTDGTAAGSSASSSSLFAPAPRPDQRQRLQSLLASVSDPTGRQDLARHLRGRLLLRAASELGCARLARGDCATTLAAHIVAAASKGCGYSLAGDVRLVDARHGGRLPPVFLPLREVSARELGVVCARWRLPLADPSVLGRAAWPAQAVDKKNINALAAAFVAGMEAHNPGSVPNILNTISKLEEFPWNDPPAPAGSQPGQQQQQANGGQVHCDEQQQEQQLVAVLCPICSAPLADDELPGGSGGGDAEANGGHTSGGSGTAAAAAAAGCCLSCFQQILGGIAGGAASGSSVAAALPGDVQQQMAGLAAAGPRAAAAASGPCITEQLRQQIAEFLL